MFANGAWPRSQFRASSNAVTSSACYADDQFGHDVFAVSGMSYALVWNVTCHLMLEATAGCVSSQQVSDGGCPRIARKRSSSQQRRLAAQLVGVIVRPRILIRAACGFGSLCGRAAGGYVRTRTRTGSTLP